MRAPVDMSAEERRSGLCRQCGFRPVYESDAILCEDCYEETRQSHQQKIAADNTAKKSGHKVLWVLGIIAVLFIIGRCASTSSDQSSNTPASDQRAYDELRANGYSESEARDAAAGVRRLCEAGGGTDCR
jgi:hypothetical protein